MPLCEGGEDEIETLSVAKIMAAIRDDLKIARERSFLNGSAALSTALSRKIAGIKKPIERMLWKYGLRYARVIKRVPFVKRIAEKSYWGLAMKNVIPETLFAPTTEASGGVSEGTARGWSDFYSEDADETFLQRNAAHHQYFMELVEQYAKKTAEGIPSLIEIGIGTGTMAIFFSRRSFSVVGIDDDPRIVARAIKRNERLGGQARFMCIEASTLSEFFKKGIFDVAFSQGTLEHFDDEGIKKLINAQLKVARYVVFSVPSVHWPHKEFGDERKITREDCGRILANLGFSVEHVSYYQEERHIAVVIGGGQRP
jgi:predicted RNA methylase